MIKVAVAALGADAQSKVPDFFEEATHLIIIDAESGSILDSFDGSSSEPAERSLLFASRTAELDCEALLSGEIEEAPYHILAIRNCVTRYMAAGYGAADAVERMNRYALRMLTDCIGGTGCEEHDHSTCACHDHGEEGQGE